MTDGSTAITLTGSHALGDGIAASTQVVKAVLGMRPDLGYPPPRSRTRTRAVLADLRQAVRDLPETARSAAAVVKLVTGGRKETKAAHLPALTAIPAGEMKRNVVLPAVFATLDVGEWDATAERLGGNGHSLLAGFAAKVAEKLGRVSPDGTVTLLIPISERDSFDDDRANAVSMANAKVDPEVVARDLSAARTAMRDSVQKAREEPDQLAGIMALIPWVPKRAMRPIADAAFGFSADIPVFCSNVGDLPAEMLRADGTEAGLLDVVARTGAWASATSILPIAYGDAYMLQLAFLEERLPLASLPPELVEFMLEARPQSRSLARGPSGQLEYRLPAAGGPGELGEPEPWPLPPPTAGAANDC
jgi:hypothetical protein